MDKTNSIPVPKHVKDMTGKVFGLWQVIGLHSIEKKLGALWLCRCSRCGKEKPVVGCNLRSGASRGCKRCTQMRYGKPPEYGVWATMLSRCRNPNSTGYYKYGARGITVCERWMSFENFYADMGLRPSSQHSIDRIDNNGNYEPGNCRWATTKDQQRNTRRNHLLTYNGRTACIVQWAEETGIDQRTIWQRLQMGWTMERALTAPVRGHKRSTHRSPQDT